MDSSNQDYLPFAAHSSSLLQRKFVSCNEKTLTISKNATKWFRSLEDAGKQVLFNSSKGTIFLQVFTLREGWVEAWSQGVTFTEKDPGMIN